MRAGEAQDASTWCSTTNQAYLTLTLTLTLFANPNSNPVLYHESGLWANGRPVFLERGGERRIAWREGAWRYYCIGWDPLEHAGHTNDCTFLVNSEAMPDPNPNLPSS